ncbi:hypothetical protein CASFOL_029210 [Castilleja foliolosa]|uniref:Replication factor A C-terminal domain-containing protein n=1 Tax=Castilleja foliolosa TaxID=1961234 RepID=A0ABD3CBT5_9LAMI
MRKHGWQLPYHPLQVVAVAVFLALGFAFYVFFAPFVGRQLFQYIAIGIYTPLTPRNFICETKITQIHEDRGWYYVLCSKCSNKLYPEQDSESLIFVCKDDDDITPNFRYCVNATITDETGNVDTVFFNDSMQEMLNISCMEMVTKHAHTTNPQIIPQQLKSAVDTPRRLHLTLKNDGKIVVNNVSNATSATVTQTSIGTSTFTPKTPLPKAATSKRPLAETQEMTKSSNDHKPQTTSLFWKHKSVNYLLHQQISDSILGAQ